MMRKIIIPRFKMIRSTAEVYNGLIGAYKAEVTCRRMKFNDNEKTRYNIYRVAESLTAENPKLGFLLCGSCGNGKTTMVKAVRSLINFYNDCGDRYDDFGELQLVIKDARQICTMATAQNQAPFQELKQMPMLCVEDIGKEPAEIVSFGNVIKPIVDLIEFRYSEQMYTAMTSNLAPKDFADVYGKRIADRLNEMIDIIPFDNTSYRAI